MKILLTGYEGFIGKNILKDLNHRNDFVTGIEKDEIKGLLSEWVEINNLVKQCDVVLHNGAISDTSLQDYNEMLFYNYHFTKVLVDLAKKYDKKVIYASSASVYGSWNNDKNTVPNNIYAWSKLIGEEYGRLTYPGGFTALRYFNVYGPHEEHKGKMSSIAYQAYSHSKMIPFSLFPKNPKRDFVYVKDVVSANIKAIESPTGVYDVGTSEPKEFEDILDLLEIPYTHTSEDKIPSWYQHYTCANKYNWLPNWVPEYNIEKGIKDYREYLEK